MKDADITFLFARIIFDLF